MERDRLANEKEILANLKVAEREKDLVRLRAMQEKMSDKQAAQDALRSKRAFEAYEREWRIKEKDSAIKHLQQEESLRDEREKQQEIRQLAVAGEARKVREQFYQTLEQQKRDEVRLSVEKEKRNQMNKAYAAEIQVV